MDEQQHKDKRISSMNERSLRDFNIEEARGWTIDRLQQIEYRVNNIIIEYFKPAEKETFSKILLNSSILDIGSKLKILYNIGTVEKKVIEKIRTLSSIRNGFAHAPISEEITIIFDSESEPGVDKGYHVVNTTIEVMNSQGQIKTKIALDYLEEFWDLYNEIRKEI